MSAAGIGRWAWQLPAALLSLLLHTLYQIHLSGDVFLLKGGRFWGEVAFESVNLARVSAYGGFILLPGVWRLLRSGFPTAMSVRSALLVLAVSVLAAFPWSLVSAASGLPPRGTIVQEMLRDGLTAPVSMLCVALIAAQLIRNGPGGALAAASIALWFAFLLLSPLWRGTAFPRLEDEVAYHLQGLLFRSGLFEGNLLFPSFASASDAERHLPVAWIQFVGTTYSSVHLDGWSFVLALFGAAHLSGFASTALALTAIVLFWVVASRMFGHSAVGVGLAVTLFVAVRLTPALANTYMSHVFALALSLGCVWAWLELDNGRPRRTRIAAAGALFLLSSLYALTRLQTFGPLLLSFLIADLWGDAGAIQRRARLKRTLVVLAAAGAGALATWLYGLASGTAHYVATGCHSPGIGPGHGCFPTYGTLGHSFTKLVWNGMDLLGRWNQEAGPGGLPIALFVVSLAFLRFRTAGRAVRMLVLLFGGHTLLHALYFHNGGESYRGRFLTEASFTIPLLCGWFYERWGAGRWDNPDRLLIPIALLSLLSATLVGVRTDYFHPYLKPVRSIAALASPPLRNTLVIAPYHPDIAPASGLVVPDEFDRQRVVRFSPGEIQRFLNVGASTAVATADRIGPHGFPMDASGNVFIGPVEESRIRHWVRHLGLERAARLHYHSARPGTEGNRWLRLWRSPEITVELIPDSAPR